MRRIRARKVNLGDNRILMKAVGKQSTTVRNHPKYLQIFTNLSNSDEQSKIAKGGLYDAATNSQKVMETNGKLTKSHGNQ